MFEALKATRALVLDMRGYPKGTAWAIASRINTKQAKYGAQFLMPLAVGYGGEQADQRVRFLQAILRAPQGRRALLWQDRRPDRRSRDQPQFEEPGCF